MANQLINTKQDILREHFAKFTQPAKEQTVPVAEIMSQMQQAGWIAYLFGGTLRDLMHYGHRAKVRDIDIVIHGATADKMQCLWHKSIVRRTRFGGLHLNYRGCLFDLWQLEDTWAFKHSCVKDVDFASLPKTTFLNVEAIVMEMTSIQDCSPNIYEHGFFRGFAEKKVEINLRENPYPALNIVRSFVTAEKLKFSIGQYLIDYIVEHAKRITVEEMVDAQKSHYGNILWDCDRINALITDIREQKRTSGNTATFYLPQWEYRHSYRTRD